MPRTYKPKPGSKTYRKYDNVVIQQALQDLRHPNTSTAPPSIASVAEKHGIPFSVLQRHNQKIMKSQGGQTALTPEAEENIIRNLNICADWGYPLERLDLRYIVKMYLDSANISIKRFKNNFPGPDFADNFLKRHSDRISKRISQNIKLSRAKVSPETMQQYFTELENSLEGVPLSNIINYDETNLADDPGREKVIVKRGCKYPERVRNHSKGCVSLMIAANAEGELLPSYVVYKSTHLYDTWTANGPTGTRYNRSSSGWFDGPIFIDWVETIVIPYFDNKEGKKVLIGDNLSSHLSADLITKCKEKNIHFVFLPPNSTHLTQPLDVAFFRPMKLAWRQILKKWKINDGRCLSSIPKGCFPKLLKLLFQHMTPTAEQNIRSGFRKTGIVPLNSQEVISRLPNDAESRNDATAVDDSFVQLLKEMRYGTMNVNEPKKKKKLEVVAGRSVDPEKLVANDTILNLDSLNQNKKSQKNKGQGKKAKKQPQLSIEQEPISILPPNPQLPTARRNTPETTITSEDIECMPIILGEDLFYSQEEEICGYNLKDITTEVSRCSEYKNERRLEAVAGPSLDPEELVEKDRNLNLDSLIKIKESMKNKGQGKKTKKQPQLSIEQEPISILPPYPQPQTASINIPETTLTSADIECMPIILAEDLFDCQEEEICGNNLNNITREVNRCSEYKNEQKLKVVADTSTDPEKVITKDEDNLFKKNIKKDVEDVINTGARPKKSQIKILSQVIIKNADSLKRIGKPLKKGNNKKIKDDVYEAQSHLSLAANSNTKSQQNLRSSMRLKNYYNNAEEILKILNE